MFQNVNGFYKTNYLDSKEVKQLIEGNHITKSQALKLTYEQVGALRRKEIFDRVIAGTLDIRLAHVPNVQYYVDQGLITVKQILNLLRWNAIFLSSCEAKKLIYGKHLTFQQVLALTQAKKSLVITYCDYINQGLNTVEEILSLEKWQAELLDFIPAEELIKGRCITINQALGVTDEQAKNLERTYRDIIEGRITVEQAKNLAEWQIEFLKHPRIEKLIDNNYITIDQTLALTQEQAENFKRIYIDIRQERITFEQFINLTEQQQVAVFDFCGMKQNIRELIDLDCVTMDQILGYTHRQLNNLIRAINDQETWERLRGGAITVQYFLNQLNQRIQINNRQSTHTKSVHESVSESASKLFKNYGSELNEVGLDNIIEDLSEYVQSLPDDPPENHVAKRAIKRMTAIDFTFTDRSSDISTLQLLALIWIAINKIPKQLELFKTAKQKLVEGLYETQRENNLQGDNVRLNIADTDDGDPDDANACSSGSFNKLVEKMNSILPEVEIIFINRDFACIKLQSVVKEKTLECLRSAKQDKPESFPQLLEQINNEGVYVIWDEIREQVKNEMVEDFSSLFRGGSDGEDFRAFIDSGQDTNLGQLTLDQFEEDDVPTEETHMSFTP